MPPSGRPMTREEKNALAMLLLQQAGDLVEFFGEMVKNSALEPGTLDQVSAQDASRQLGLWLKRLPGSHWDDRLTFPEE